MKKINPPVLAIVVPCFNEGETLNYTFEGLLEILEKMVDKSQVSKNSFLVFIDDGSSDNTWSLINEKSKIETRVKGVRLSRNFGHQNALMAGLSTVVDECDISISIDADLQQDPQAMSEFIEKYSSGADIVFGVRKNSKGASFFKRFTSSFFYGLMQLMGAEILPDHADYRLLSNRALKALLTFQEPNLFLRGLCLKLGFNTAIVHHQVFDREHGQSKYSLSKMLNLAVNGIVSLSIFPLRIIAVIGFVCSLITAVMGVYVLWHSLIAGNTVPGWASTILPIYFIGGVQLLSLGVFGEYLGKVYATVQNRPRWIISENSPSPNNTNDPTK